jgi:hypothetical protein
MKRNVSNPDWIRKISFGIQIRILETKMALKIEESLCSEKPGVRDLVPSHRA